jgi:FKBP-type peptidyl-prolyl cis-trans isomerase FklB
MKKIPLLLLFVAFISSLCAQNLSNNMDTVSYSVGVLIAKNLKNQGMEKIDPASMAAAVEDVFSGNDLKISPEQANGIFQKYMQEQAAKLNADKIAAGKTFLEENAKREGVTVLPSGLQYEVLTPGTGERPTASNKVTVHYEGTLIDGTIFDSSYKRGNPATFGVTQVIQGWVEGLQLMQTGAKWKLYIPYDLAYGERGSPPQIKPFSALIFTVELISIQ